jgi:hypothetical protein
VRNLTIGEVYQAEPYPRFMMEIIQAGGLVPYTRQQLSSVEVGNQKTGESGNQTSVC